MPAGQQTVDRFRRRRVSPPRRSNLAGVDDAVIVGDGRERTTVVPAAITFPPRATSHMERMVASDLVTLRVWLLTSFE